MKDMDLSREISYALRHAPWEYELEMDGEGWVPVEQLLDALHRTEKWSNICEADLNEMIKKSEKKRHELADGRIRAFYGHSIPMKILKEEKMPPDVLYHGTARRFLESINENGLLPQSRQYVHLSRQECGVQGISWHSADTLGHIFPRAECETTIRLRMRNGKTTILQLSLTE